MKETFDIFSGWPEKVEVWLEAVEGLFDARRRMEQIAEHTPGHYFIFSVQHRSCVAEIDTFVAPNHKSKSSAA